MSGRVTTVWHLFQTHGPESFPRFHWAPKAAEGLHALAAPEGKESLLGGEDAVREKAVLPPTEDL